MAEIETLKKIIIDFISNDLFVIARQQGLTYFDGHFPRGCCGASCDLLLTHCKILKKEGFRGHFNENLKRKYLKIGEDLQSHAWIENDEFIIDITAHQFNERLGREFDKIIVCKKEKYPLKKYLTRLH